MPAHKWSDAHQITYSQSDMSSSSIDDLQVLYHMTSAPTTVVNIARLLDTELGAELDSHGLAPSRQPC